MNSFVKLWEWTCLSRKQCQSALNLLRFKRFNDKSNWKILKVIFQMISVAVFQFVPLQRFGFLVLVFSGLAYVTDPNAHASTKRVAWATLPHPPIILTAYQFIIAYPQSYPVFLVYQIVLAYLLYSFSLNMFERVFGFPQTCAVAVEAVVGRIAILVILVVSCLVLGDAVGMRHVGRFNC